MFYRCTKWIGVSYNISVMITQPIYKKLNTLFMIIMLSSQVILLGVILLFFKTEIKTASIGEVKEAMVDWTLCYENGDTVEVKEFPAWLTCDAGEEVCLRGILPAYSKDKTLFFLSAEKEITVTVDGEVIYEFGRHDVRLFGKTPGSITNYIKLPKRWNKGEIAIYMKSEYANYAAYLPPMYIADDDVSVLYVLRTNLLKIACSLVMLFVGSIFVLLAIINAASNHPTDGMAYVGSLFIWAAVYFAIETKTMNIFYGNEVVYSFLVFSFMMCFPILLIHYLAASTKVRLAKSFRALLFLSYVDIAVQVILQVFNIADFMDMANIPHALMLLALLLGTANYIILMKEDKKPTYLLELVALMAIMIGGVLDVVRSFYIKVGDLGRLSRIGTLIYAVMLLFIHIRRIAYATRKEMDDHIALIEARNEELKEAENRANLANRAKSEFLSQMSHEIRTPLNAVLGMNEMIIREAKDDSIIEYAGAIHDSGNALLSIINDVLDISKIEAGRIEIVPAQYRLHDLLSDAFHMIGDRAKRKELAFEVKVDRDLPSVLYGDMVRIRQILINLLTNAVKYTEKGTITLEVFGEVVPKGDLKGELLANESMHQVSVPTESNEDILVLHAVVRDTGMGIRPEDIDKLFNKFTRVDIKRNQSIEGTGLGLAISKQLALLMDGDINVASDYGVGSRFELIIPQMIVNKSPLGNISFEYKADEIRKARTQEEFKAPDTKVLVVDDVRVNLRVFANLLKKTEIQVEAAISGAECLEMIQKSKYDIIFMDHMMPEMDGLETFEKIRQQETGINRDTPVVMLTANAISGMREQYLDMGFAGYLIKPIKPDELEAMIKDLLGKEV